MTKMNDYTGGHGSAEGAYYGLVFRYFPVTSETKFEFATTFDEVVRDPRLGARTVPTLPKNVTLNVPMLAAVALPMY